MAIGGKYKGIDFFGENLKSLNRFDTHIDPDSNFYRNVTQNCSYYDEKPFDIQLKAINGFSLIHFNARSLHENSGKINLYRHIINRSFDVVAITETWQTDTNIVDTFLPDYMNPFI